MREWRRARVRRLATTCVVWLLLPGWSDAKSVTPQVLLADADLPPRQLEVDLGEQTFDPRQEEREAGDVVGYYASDVGLLNDPDLQARVEGIAHKVITAAVAVGPKQLPILREGETYEGLQFRFWLLDSDDINAFSAWNGNIYLTRAMIEFCQSDDELAGIIAHETAHTLYHHLREMVKRLQRYQQQQILAMIGAAFMGLNVAHAALATQYLYLALMNGHSVENETQADYAGCFYAYRAGYNPVGMITVFERLERLYRSRPNPVDLGAFQTHPWSVERAHALEAQIKALGLPINRRDVTHAITAGVRVSPGNDGQPPVVELLLGDTPLLRLAAGGDDPTAEDRAADQALAINRALHNGLKSTDLRLAHSGERYVVRALGEAKPVDLIDNRAADAAAAGRPLDDFAQAVFRRCLARARQEEINHGAL